MIARPEEFHHALVQILRIRHVAFQARGKIGPKPGKEQVLATHARPDPGEMTAAPVHRQFREIVRENVIDIGRFHVQVTVGNRHDDAVRVTPRQLQRAKAAGVISIDRRPLDAQLVEQGHESVGEVGHCRLLDRQRAGQAVAGRVRREHRVILRQAPDQRHVFGGRVGRLMQQEHRRAIAGPAVVNLALADGGEVT